MIKNTIAILVLIFLCLSCKKNNREQKSFNKKPIKIDSLKPSLKSDIQNKKDSRTSYTLKFENGDVVNVVSNFFPREVIDSFSQSNKNIRGKYFYCFKGGISLEVFKILRKNGKELKVNTAHSIIVEKDTLFFNGKNNVPCLKENDSILIKSIVYTFYQKGLETNLLIIDDLIKK